MGKYAALTDRQKRLVVDLVEVAGGEVVSFMLWVKYDERENALDGPGGRRLKGVPADSAFYEDLRSKGYLAKQSYGTGETWRVTSHGNEYALYVHKNRLSRWWEDLRYDLGHDDTLRSKIIWASGTVVVANLAFVVMKLLGWYD